MTSKSCRRLRSVAVWAGSLACASWFGSAASGCSGDDPAKEPRSQGAAGDASAEDGGRGQGDGGSGETEIAAGAGAGEGGVPHRSGLGGAAGWADDASSNDAGASGSAGDTELDVAAGWEPFSERVNSGNAAAHDPQLAFDASGKGRAFAIWSGTGPSDEDVFVSRFDGTWSEPQSLTAGVALGREPQIAADGHGNAVAIWCQLDADYYTIYTSRYSAGSGDWGPPTPYLVPGALDVHTPSVGADFDGNVVAAWRQDYGQNGQVEGSIVLASVLAMSETPTWSSPVLLSVGEAAQSGSPRVALSSLGDGFVVWDQNYENNRVIYAARYTRSLGFEPARKVGASDFSAADPDVAVTAAGNAVAVWRQRGADGSWGVSSNDFAAITGNWAPANLPLSANASEVGSPRVASNPGGAYTVAWWQSQNGKRSLYASRGQLKPNGQGQGMSGVAIETDERGDAQQPSVTVGEDGTALVAWSQFLGATDNVVLATSSGDAWQLGTLQTRPARQAATPVVRIEPKGKRALALWQELSGAKNIFGAVFTAN